VKGTDMTDDKPKYIDDLTCREVYAETTQTLLGAPGVLRVELCVNRWTQEPPVRSDRIVPVARFAISASLAMVLRDQLSHCLEAIEQQTQLAQIPAASPTKQ
jgi:hypothetical protein